MATAEEAQQAILDAIAAAAAHVASGKTSSGSAEQLGSAVRQLAEGLAWLRFPAQPH